MTTYRTVDEVHDQEQSSLGVYISIMVINYASRGQNSGRTGLTGGNILIGQD